MTMKKKEHVGGRREDGRNGPLRSTPWGSREWYYEQEWEEWIWGILDLEEEDGTLTWTQDMKSFNDNETISNKDKKKGREKSSRRGRVLDSHGRKGEGDRDDRE